MNYLSSSLKPIAYFCAEYAIEADLPIFAGGLGILAADFLRQAGTDGVPLHAFGLIYGGDAHSAGFELLAVAGDPLIIDVDLGGRTISVQTWTKRYGSARLYLLDTNVPSNSPADQAIGSNLYDPDLEVSLMQQLLLGMAGVKLLGQLGIEPGVYHLNEGHMAFIVLGLILAHKHSNPELTQAAALQQVTASIVATKHTILSAAGIKIDRDQFTRFLAPLAEQYNLELDQLFELGTTDTRPHLFSTTQFLLAHAVRANAVSVLHAEYELRKHPQSQLIAITNGILPTHWLAAEWHATGADVWETRQALRRRLVNRVHEETQAQLDPNVLTIVWARRITSYKRPSLIVSDLAKLASVLASPHRPVQIIISGTPSAQDLEAQQAMQAIVRATNLPEFKDKLVFLPNYDMGLAETLVQGADVWLNTPLVGQEACGTSGMKAGLNGALQLSAADGWIPEVDWQGIGWVLPDEKPGDVIYQTINESIAPLFYDRSSGQPVAWIERIKKTRAIVAGQYTTERMLSDYVANLYYPNADLERLAGSSDQG